MWRGWHKLPGGEDTFDQLANIASSFPTSSSAGEINICGIAGEALFALVIDGAFPVSYYDTIIQKAELKGFELALLNQGSGQQEKGITMTSVRSNERCIIDDDDLANKLWSIVEQHLPPRDIVPGKRYKGWRAVGVNPRFRILKYSPGERFELHQDGSYHIEAGCVGDNRAEQQSFVTLQLYLNDGGGISFTGGATRFIEPCRSSSYPSSPSLTPKTVDIAGPDSYKAKVFDVVPMAGRLLLFQHNCWHEGEIVTSGIKYVLRSEVLFSKE